ncbi:bile acid 7-alpha-dehydratase [Chryseobacterium sp. Leaf405]|uniref:nuclear transport factor 2 family protein n=1 Tax=Chryseobacterium sp. Leaf405 TaxID=1736367 RepID=UPI0006FC05A3|nr:nuclear transport factor 2 family protein [Chryseobacterium sp. Leaf405]KQT27636.1 bile acid 7-alpha-dehydratase [Chryseobacterium sp. Leaf405]
MTITEIQARISLKELIDKVSILGDQKDFQAQVQLFSENAVSETLSEGKTILRLKGRKEMAEAFSEFLENFETVYHFNGQQQLTINGNKATGTVYCLITLIGIENGKKMKTIVGAIYNDDYIYEDDRWTIEKRIGHFKWQEKTEFH